MAKKYFMKPILSVGVVITLFIGCHVKNPAVDESVAPVLSELMAPGQIFLQSDVKYPLSVRSFDPQGWEDILSVNYMIFPKDNPLAIHEAAMLDDGTGGDIIPQDGIFFDSLSTDFASGLTGSYRLKVIAVDRAGNSSDTLYGDVQVIDGEINLPPILSDPVVPDTLQEDALNTVFLSVRAEDPQGNQDIDTVHFQIYPPWSPVHTYTGRLLDNGLSGDVSAGDDIYSFQGDLTDILTTKGDYTVRFQAKDDDGLNGIPIIMTFTVFRDNGPPVLSNLVAPNQVSRSSNAPILLSVEVTDPQGLSDIKSVFFNTTKPDGSPSSGNPFSMFDDGSSGDVTSGDGVYSLIIHITPQNALGDYRFDFIAEDYAGALSAKLQHTISVVE